MCHHQEGQPKVSFRQALGEIVQYQNCLLKSKQNGSKTQITEKVKWLENKVQQQSTQIQTLSNQLSREIKVKEHTQCLLDQQKEKTIRLHNSVNETNRHNNLIKTESIKKSSADNENNRVIEKKVLHIVEKIRKKKDLHDKKRLKIDENGKQSNNCLQIDQEGPREILIGNQNKEQSLLQEIQSLKIQLREKDLELSHSHRQFCKIKMEYQLLLKQLCSQQEEIKIIHTDTKELMKSQNQEINKLQNQLAHRCPDSVENMKWKWNLGIAKRQMRKALSSHLKDDCVRKKVQIQMLIVLEGVSVSGSHTPRQMSTARE